MRLPPAATVALLLGDALAGLRDLEARLARLAEAITRDPGEQALTEYADVLAEADARDVWAGPARLAAALDGLGVAGLPGDRPLGTLSGGQAARLALAVLLVTRPGVLLLDEPTDHLSLTLVEELEQAIRGWPGPLVAVSHDRWLRRGWTGQQVRVEAGQVRGE